MVRRSARQWQIAIVAILLVAIGGSYFVYHAFHGQRGLLARGELITRLADLQHEHANLLKERKVWERRVDLLSADKLDPDFLEENVRSALNWAHPNDVLLVERAIPSAGPR